MIADFANFCTFEPGNLKQDEQDFQDCQDETFLVKREPVPSSVGYLKQDKQNERDFQDCQSIKTRVFFLPRDRFGIFLRLVT